MHRLSILALVLLSSLALVPLAAIAFRAELTGCFPPRETDEGTLAFALLYRSEHPRAR